MGTSHGTRLRFGVLGTAHITPVVLLQPARRVPEVEVIAVASRDERRARRFAGAKCASPAMPVKCE